MSMIANLGVRIWSRLVVWTQALNRALSEPAPLETDAFSHQDDGGVFQRRPF